MQTCAADQACRFLVTTPPAPGAIGVIQLLGNVMPVLERLTNIAQWPCGRLRLATLGGIDEGLAVRLTDQVAQLMPHGGRRVVEQLLGLLLAWDVQPVDVRVAVPQQVYPEAADPIEALMLETLARAMSPLAIDLLLDQPRRWRDRPSTGPEDRQRWTRLNRLLTPPLVVLAGRANVGKSTLSNALFGRPVSIALDRPGTTRDYTSGALDLAGLLVLWHDTPGLRDDETNAIEARAVEIADRVIRRADLLIALTDHEQDWPALPREPDLRVANKRDLARRNDADLEVSAADGTGIGLLVTRVRETLVPPEDLAHPGAWVFDERLQP
jgi:hypothetical protein